MGALQDALLAAMRQDDPYLEGVQASGESIEDLPDMRFFEFHHVELDHCVLSGAMLAKTSWYDATLVACDLSNADLSEAFFSRTRLVDCKLEGAKLNGAIARSTRFVHCMCRYSNWQEAKLEQVRLMDCDLREAFLSELRLRRSTRLEGCDLARADLFRTALKGVDLSTCNIAGITISDTRAELAGALISVEQAADVAVMLGVRFVDA